MRRHTDIDTEGVWAMMQVEHDKRGADTRPAGRVRRRTTRRLGLAGTLATALMVAACGSSVPHVSTPVHTTSATTAAAAKAAHTSTSAHRRPRRERRVVKRVVERSRHHAAAAQTHPRAGVQTVASVSSTTTTRSVTPKTTPTTVVQKPAAGTGGNTANDDNPGGKASRADAGGRPTVAGLPNPCALVSTAQAGSITGHAITAHEAPLGPTCIYEGTGTAVTMAVERVRVTSLTRRIQKLVRQSVGGHTVYCGHYGSPITYAVLSGQDRVLSITAPCAVGTRFAAAALAKLG